jgi:16S rRNA (cytosine967-C5)-methyltransferase
LKPDQHHGLAQDQYVASQLLRKVLDGSNLDTVLSEHWRSHPDLPARHRGAIQDLTYGCLRHLSRLDALIARLQKRAPAQAALQDLLRVAFYQLLYTQVKPHVVVDQAVSACDRADLSRARGFVNALLRNLLRQRAALEAAVDSDPVARYSHPQWWINRLQRDWPHDWPGLLEIAGRHPPMTLRVNVRRITREDYRLQLQEADIAARDILTEGLVLEKPCAVQALPGFREGLFSVQDAGAQLAERFLDLHDGLRVLDACAAPGGKSCHMLEKHDVALVAADIDDLRLRKVQENLDRLGLSAQLLSGDAADRDAVAAWGGFDRILADVPCTASGVTRRHPDIKWLRQPRDIDVLGRRQQSILASLWQSLNRGGKLLYATCSVFADENRRQVDRFIESHSDARLCDLPAVPGYSLKQGQLLPDPLHDGFFYALLEKA